MKCNLLISIVTLSALMTVSGVAPAQASSGSDTGILFGIRSADFSSDGAGAPDYKSSLGMAAGVITMGDMGGMKFRTGGYYATRGAEVTGTGYEADIEIATLDVPVTVLFSMNEMVSLFAGGLFALRVSDDCSGNDLFCDAFSDELESFYTAASFGMNAKFHPNWSGEISYELGLSDVADELSLSTLAVSAVFIY